MSGGLLDVLVPTRDRPAALAVTLAGLAAQTVPGVRVVISDQSRTPVEDDPLAATAVRIARHRGHRVEVLRHVPPRGLAEQRQFLLERAERRFALYLDDDVWLEPAAAEVLLAAIGELGCGFVGFAIQGLSYLADVRPHELSPYEEWTGGGRPWWPYKVAWIGGCVLYDRERLVERGGFGFWRSVPRRHAGEDLVAQLRVMEEYGGAGLLPSMAYHLELPTTVADRSAECYDYVMESR